MRHVQVALRLRNARVAEHQLNEPDVDAVREQPARPLRDEDRASAGRSLALLLSIIGVYGLTASDVVARWRELAIRLALGASHRRAFWTVVRPCAVVLVIGAALGVLGALSVGPALASLLHGVGPTDVWALGLAPMLLGIIGALAAVLAARRVLQADPATTLRSD